MRDKHMSHDVPKRKLALEIRRVRSRIAANIKTGLMVSYNCNMRTDPTQNGEYCEPTMGNGVTHCASTNVGA
jgi:hypothetical protein